MIILDGNKLSKELLEVIKEKLKKDRLSLKLGVVLVGSNLISSSYINKKKQACLAAGIGFKLFNFPTDIREENLKEEIKKIVGDKEISGVVVQLPLPPKFNTAEILDLICPEKDVDVLSEASFKKFSANQLHVSPPVVGAVKYLLEKYNISIKDKEIVLIGKGKLVGRPISVWLTNDKVPFHFVDKTSGDISDITKKSDIIISGTGCPGLIKKSMVKDGAVLIDVGTSSEEGKIKGDIDPSSYEMASYVAPVPGGVGPMTIACLIDNLLELNQK